MITRYKKKGFLWLAIAVLAVIGLTIGVFFVVNQNSQISQGAVVANGIECAEIGRTILERGGSAVDAAIATLFCEGIACPQSMGLGGGFIATIYTRSTKEVVTLTAREMAPIKATEDMFVNKTITGALSAAVPGELRGYWQLHQRYGRLPWRQLVEPAIHLARNGYIVTEYLSRSLKGREKMILKNPTLSEIFINPRTGRVWVEGDIATRPILAESLEIIANEGERAMYDGGILGRLLSKDVKQYGGIIEEQDFWEYKARWDRPVVTGIRGRYTLYTTPLPGSGSILAFIINLVNELETSDRQLFWHRMIESFKHGYAARTNLGDVNFVPEIQELVSNLSDVKYAREIRQLVDDSQTFNSYSYYGANYSGIEDHGTANMAVLAPNGDAITVTSTINDILGAKFRSPSTGILLNDEMDDFSTPGRVNGFGIPPSPANFIRPKKMPLSSMCPSIILDENDNVRLLIGSAGGSKITTSVAMTIIRHLYLNEPLNFAVQARRLHHQLAPMRVMYEMNFDNATMLSLRRKGHFLEEIPTLQGFSALTAIGVVNGRVEPVYDIRRNGSVSIV